MTSVHEVTTEAEYESVLSTLQQGALINVFFHTPWAAPCKQMRTFFETLASQYPSSTPPKIAFLAINAEELPEISEAFNVTAVPFVVLTRNGKTLDTISGSNSARVRDAVEKEFGEGSKVIPQLPNKLDTEPRLEKGIANGTSAVAPTPKQNTKDLSGYTPSPGGSNTGPGLSSAHQQPDNSLATAEDLNTKLSGLVKAAPVMLFMKGTPSSPQCGFSRQLVQILRERGVRYGFFNILADEDVRQGMKTFADWPTFPQLWVGGELVGGLDIVKEELQNDPQFFDEYSVGKGPGGVAVPDQQKAPQTAAASAA